MVSAAPAPPRPSASASASTALPAAPPFPSRRPSPYGPAPAPASARAPAGCRPRRQRSPALKQRRASLALLFSRLVLTWHFRDDTNVAYARKGKVRRLAAASGDEDDRGGDEDGPANLKKVRRTWTQEETQMLVDGCNLQGVKAILSDPTLAFTNRSPVDLMGRYVPPSLFLSFFPFWFPSFHSPASDVSFRPCASVIHSRAEFGGADSAQTPIVRRPFRLLGHLCAETRLRWEGRRRSLFPACLLAPASSFALCLSAFLRAFLCVLGLAPDGVRASASGDAAGCLSGCQGVRQGISVQRGAVLLRPESWNAADGRRDTIARFRTGARPCARGGQWCTRGGGPFARQSSTPALKGVSPAAWPRGGMRRRGVVGVVLVYVSRLRVRRAGEALYGSRACLTSSTRASWASGVRRGVGVVLV
ncbi:hypothetical protein B0H17DRAFT_1204490 [Mycena rosella]|uniref:Myb-like domain-containing protein n=1 Tax=Mycena rosella TaxID=1033263 RepID=A0AAD7D932_MYCRO|nr:hypothetical protein B0H17DRAFT_1204490 [Mycena rosella]